MVLVQLLYLSARISSAGPGLPVESGLSGVAALQKLLEERDHPVGVALAIASSRSVCRTRPDSGSTDRSQLCHRGSWSISR